MNMVSLSSKPRNSFILVGITKDLSEGASKYFLQEDVAVNISMATDDNAIINCFFICSF